MAGRSGKFWEIRRAATGPSSRQLHSTCQRSPSKNSKWQRMSSIDNGRAAQKDVVKRNYFALNWIGQAGSMKSFFAEGVFLCAARCAARRHFRERRGFSDMPLLRQPGAAPSLLHRLHFCECESEASAAATRRPVAVLERPIRSIPWRHRECPSR
jgi:hypothetical protein